jgi:LysR family transcriptional regulator, glycine cleavage system transcriptional activator
MKNRELVPLNALRAFEAAGRLTSFVAAAEELHVTPAAISHHIKLLEDFIGTPLFVRRHRAIDITDAGRSFLGPLTDSFRAIEETTTRMRGAHRCGPLRVRVASCLAAKWLLPRLGSFYRQHPDIEIEVSVSSQIYNFRYNEMDALIRLRCGEFNGMVVESFMTEYVAPICTPDFFARHGPILNAEALLGIPLIHDDNLNVVPTFPNWGTWLRAAGVQTGDDLPGHRFDSSSMVLDTTLEGLGVSLGRSALASRDLDAGRLVRLLEFDYPVTHEYFLVYPKTTPKLRQINALRNWLATEADATISSWAPRHANKSPHNSKKSDRILESA